MDWTAISGIAASVAAVASLIAALATLVGVIVGTVALVFAGIAAWQSGRQAEASIQATKAAQEQLSLSQPRPVLLLRCSWNGFEVENVGEHLAIEAQVETVSIAQDRSHEHYIELTFLKEEIVRPGQRIPLRLILHELHPEAKEAQIREVLKTLVTIARANAENLGQYSKLRPWMGEFRITYKNARGSPFSSTWVLRGIEWGDNIECKLEGSLLNP